MKLKFYKISWSDVPPASLRAEKRRRLTAGLGLRRLAPSLPVPSPSSSGTRSIMLARSSSVQSGLRNRSSFTGTRSLMRARANSEPPPPSPKLSASTKENMTSRLPRKATLALSSQRQICTSNDSQSSRQSQSSEATGDLSAPSVSHFMLYLNRYTFGASAKALVEEICKAWSAKLQIVMIHEKDPARGGCEFSEFSLTTPAHLIEDGLYRQLAIPFEGGEAHRDVSRVMLAKALGAKVSSRKHSLRRSVRAVVTRGSAADEGLGGERV